MAVVPEDAGEEGLAATLQAARRLGESSFGDGTLVLERYLAAPRHIEVQVLADSHGNVVALGDRDCSIQRRHQKLIEEAPAPGLSQDMRAALAAAAVTLARDVGYVSAGTVEFLVEGERFYFLEMNTRLQVEHPVTEAITGLDLVEWQLRVARGEALGLTQEQVRLEGAAIEARVCAEDPARDFLPSAGELELLQWPQGESLRVDAGFDSGDRVPDSYDSLLGKVIAWAPSREEARANLAAALDNTRCVGVRSNERWLARIVRDPRFAAATHSVAFLGESAAELSAAPPIDERVLALAALVAHAQQSLGQHDSALSPWELTDAFIPNLPAALTYAFTAQGEPRNAVVSFAGSEPVSVTVRRDAPALPVAHVEVTGEEVSAQLGPHRLRARYFVGRDRIHLWLKEAHYEVLRQGRGRARSSSTATEQRLSTPLPGVVVSVAVAAGEKVAAGAILMVIEAMKMEHPIKAPCAGTVKAIHVRVGERVKEDTELMELAPGGLADPVSA
jgi:3-methylcrotonyl-CoA carboxylase alpha subunit